MWCEYNSKKCGVNTSSGGQEHAILKPILAPLSEVNQDMWLSQDFHLYHNSKEMWCEYQLRRARTEHILKTNFSSLIWSQSRHVTVSRLSPLPQFKRNVVWIPAQEGTVSEHAILKTNFSSLIWSQSRHVTVSRLSPLPQFKRNVVWIPKLKEGKNTSSGGQEHAILKTNFSSLIWSQSRHVTVSRLSPLPQFKRRKNCQSPENQF